MSVTDIAPRKQYDCDGVVQAFPILFKYLENDHVTVKHIDSLGNITLLILDDVGANGFAIVSDEVVTNTIYPATDDIWLIRETPLTQTTVRQNNRRTPASVDDGSFDKNMMIIQEHEDNLLRTVRLPELTALTASGELSIPVDDNAIIWDAATERFVNYAVVAEVARVDSNAADETAARIARDNSLQLQINGGEPLLASQFSPIAWHDQEIPSSVTIPDNKNAWSFGPTMSIAAGATVTIGSNSNWTIANGEVQV